MPAAVSTCAYDVFQAVLAAAFSTGDASLADHLYWQIQCDKASLIPSFLAVIRLYAAVGQPEKARDIYAMPFLVDTHLTREEHGYVLEHSFDAGCHRLRWFLFPQRVCVEF